MSRKGHGNNGVSECQSNSQRKGAGPRVESCLAQFSTCGHCTSPARGFCNFPIAALQSSAVDC